MRTKILLLPAMLFLLCPFVYAQQRAGKGLLTIDRLFAMREFVQEFPPEIQWIKNGEAYVVNEPSVTRRGSQDLVRYETATQARSLFIPAEKLIPPGASAPLEIESFTLSPDQSNVILFTNSSRVWRSNSKGDYWIYNLASGKLSRVGAQFPPSSLMFAKLSNDNKSVAYVHDFNLYAEDLQTGKTRQLTFDGSRTMINGTFDWVYEEELGCRDGFRWNPAGTNIAFWHLDASTTGTFYMINNTDSIYPQVIPVQYPKVGQPPSECKAGIINMTDGKITWIPVPGDPIEHYIPRMQWINDNLILIQQLNRKQDTLTFYTWDVKQGKLNTIWEEHDAAWVDITYSDITSDAWEMEDLPILNHGNDVLRLSEKDGWRHIYRINVITGKGIDLTPGKYDVARMYTATDKYAWFNASPNNSTRRYLYRVGVTGKADTVRITPAAFTGVNEYAVSPNSAFAIHTWSNATTPSVVTLEALPSCKVIKTFVDNSALKARLSTLEPVISSFFQVTTKDGITLDGRMLKPGNFDPSKKYPVLFYVYGEPWDQVATDSWNRQWMWHTLLAQQGYIVIAMDNRGTPCLKGSEWRKSIYRKMGQVNARDQAMAAQEVMKWNFVDSSRIAVWGWSGGGSMTLNLMFRYPDIYKTGMAVAAVSNQLTYDNIYTERYMGLPSENPEDYTQASPLSFARNLKGNLLIVHGTGDDNVHYQNTEMLINELVRQNKQFTLMSYPNRSHGIYEGPNTTRHLYTLLTNYLEKNCPAGAR